jgi:hypothetical protein
MFGYGMTLNSEKEVIVRSLIQIVQNGREGDGIGQY